MDFYLLPTSGHSTILQASSMMRATRAGAPERLIFSTESQCNRSSVQTLTHSGARFEMDYILAALPKPYVAVMDGITSAYHEYWHTQ